MNPRKTTIAILATLSAASLALADDYKTIDGKEYKNATVTRVEPDGIVIKTKTGVWKILFGQLSKEDQRLFGHDPDKIAAEAAAAIAAEEKRIEKEKAAERERDEKEKTAEANVNQSRAEFQAVEERAAQSYRSATKGTLSGQVFVSSKGGENFKLGAVEVALFSRDAIDVLIAGLTTYADIKTQALTRSADAAQTASEQRVILKSRDSYYSGSFYFGSLSSAIQTAETDADGKFIIEVPRSGRFVIAAQAKRSVMQYTEHYYWLQPVSLEGQQQVTQNLSNNNLTSTTGGSSLMHTRD